MLLSKAIGVKRFTPPHSKITHLKTSETLLNLKKIGNQLETNKVQFCNNEVSFFYEETSQEYNILFGKRAKINFGFTPIKLSKAKDFAEDTFVVEEQLKILLKYSIKLTFKVSSERIEKFFINSSFPLIKEIEHTKLNDKAQAFCERLIVELKYRREDRYPMRTSLSREWCVRELLNAVQVSSNEKNILLTKAIGCTFDVYNFYGSRCGDFMPKELYIMQKLLSNKQLYSVLKPLKGLRELIKLHKENLGYALRLETDIFVTNEIR